LTLKAYADKRKKYIHRKKYQTNQAVRYYAKEIDPWTCFT